MGAFCMLSLLMTGVMGDARADTPITAQRPPARHWFTLDEGQDEGMLSLGVAAMNMSLPRFGVNGSTTAHRAVGVAAPPNASWFYGGRLGLTGRSGSFLVELAEVSYMQTAGGSSLAANANGETVQVTRDELHKLDVGVLGVGVQGITPSGKAKLALKFDWGMSSLWSSARVSGGTGPATDGMIGDLHGFARLEAAACARSKLVLFEDSTTWGCLTGGTNIYEEGWFNGVAVGLRADF